MIGKSPVWWIAILFFLSGLAFIQKAGLHFDATNEIGGFYPCCAYAFRPMFLGHMLPMMVLPYLGAFKTWLYYPLVHWFEVTPLLLRLPTLLAGTASVVLFFVLLDRTIGRLGAIAGALLLSTDAAFLIATTYDFGPVAFLHLFLLAGVLLLLDFERTQRYGTLALAFFLFGLALWHKALFIWMLDGLIVAAAIAFPRRVVALVTPRRVLVAIVALCCGAFPLIYYNIATGGATLRTQEVMSGAAPLSQKARMVRKTMSGNVFFAWLVEEAQPATVDRHPRGLAAKASVAVSDLLHGQPRSNGMFYEFLIACCLAPWLWFTRFRRATMFVMIYLAVTWLQMAALPNTGASMHHVLLLWPFPHFLIAIAVTGMASAMLWARVAIVIAMLASNVLLLNQYFAELTINGTTAIWTDAVNPLFEYLDSLKDVRVVLTDWGYSPTLCILSDGEMRFTDISYTLLGPSEAEVKWVRTLIEDPKTVFVQHAAGSEQFTAAAARLASLTAQARRTEEVIKVIADRNHRPRFEIVRYVP